MKLFFIVLATLWLSTSSAKNTVTSLSEKISFWNQPRRGANFFNRIELKERFVAARDFGLEFVRLAPNDWIKGRSNSERGDFLIGSAHASFKELNVADLKELKRVLKMADEASIKVVLTMLALPGSRVPRHNGGKDRDLRLWLDRSFQDQAIHFWKLLAAELKDQPGIVGYNIINEPVPEWAADKPNEWNPREYSSWAESIKGTPRDLNAFYSKVVKAIRTVDRNTPIILDSGSFASPRAFQNLKPVQDDGTIYSFHFYEPHLYTHQMKTTSPIEYPGEIPVSENSGARKKSGMPHEFLNFFL